MINITTEKRLNFLGTIDKKTKERGVLLRFNCDNTIFACQTAGKDVEFFSVNNEDEIKIKLKKRKKKKRKRKKNLVKVIN